MAKHSTQYKQEGRIAFRQFVFMKDKLHEYLRNLGEEQSQGPIIKQDQFQKLRLRFAQKSTEYQSATNALKCPLSEQNKAPLLLQVFDTRNEMQGILDRMTILLLKLNKKAEQQSSLQQELVQKNLTLCAMQKVFYKYSRANKKQTTITKIDVQNGKYPSLQALIDNPAKEKLLTDADGQEEKLEESQERILQAIRGVDAKIEAKLDLILQGWKAFHNDVISINGAIAECRVKILTNATNVENANQDMANHQGAFIKAVAEVPKGNCIINIVIVVLVSLMVYLIVRVATN